MFYSVLVHCGTPSWHIDKGTGVVPIVLQSIAILLKFCNTYCNTCNTKKRCCCDSFMFIKLEAKKATRVDLTVQ